MAAHHLRKQPGKFQDLTGQIFHGLTVQKRELRPGKNTAYWLCLCACGGTATVTTQNLKSGSTRSCGCLQKEKVIRALTKHGKADQCPEYSVWCGMRARCKNPNHKAYKHYGGKGIIVCQRWDDFQLFLDDMGPRPSKKHTIERKDGRLGYCPENCHWATMHEQSRNTSQNRHLTFNGKTLCLEDWEVEIGINHNVIRRRLLRGWPIEKVLSPKKFKKSKHVIPPCQDQQVDTALQNLGNR